MRKFLKLIIFFAFIVTLLVAIYWWKCQREIDLFKNVHLTSYLPVNALNKKSGHVDIHLKSSILSFEDGRLKPHSYWSRNPQDTKFSMEPSGADGSHCVVINNSTEADWALDASPIMQVEKGEQFEILGDLKLAEGRKCTLSVVLLNELNQVVNWHYAPQSITKTLDWIKVQGTFTVPEEGKYIRLRLTGSGIGVTMADNLVLRRSSKKNEFITTQKIKPRQISNSIIDVEVDSSQSKISVIDKRNGEMWISEIDKSVDIESIDILTESSLRLKIRDNQFQNKILADIVLDSSKPELVFTLSSDVSSSFGGLFFPPFFKLQPSNSLVLPIQEGVLLPVSLVNEKPQKSIRYGGAWSMPFFGVLGGQGSWMAIIETPNDFELDLERLASFSCKWISEKGLFGYSRKIRFVFFDKTEGYVQMAKRYRNYAKEHSLFLSLMDKKKYHNENIDKLVGSVNIWYWGEDKAKFAFDLFEKEIRRVLFSNLKDASDINDVNKLGFLTSRYDIYQDVWDPGLHIKGVNTTGWPDDLVLSADGAPQKGWSVLRENQKYQGAVICSIPALSRAQKIIPEELKNKHYSARFIDTTTSSQWRECYNVLHPTTRSEDIRFKMGLLQFTSSDMKLITGSEDGSDVAVSNCDYFEGMMSLKIGRLPDSGRDVASVQYQEPTDNFLQYQVGYKYRIPLWQLVYGDAIVSTWYWGDSNNRIPEYWHRKDLFNILYGNMPLWAIRDRNHWKIYQKDFINSYNHVVPVFQKVGYYELVDHKFLGPDETVQESVFLNNIRIFVNFGSNAFKIEDMNYNLPPNGYVVFDDKELWKSGTINAVDAIEK